MPSIFSVGRILGVWWPIIDRAELVFIDGRLAEAEARLLQDKPEDSE